MKLKRKHKKLYKFSALLAVIVVMIGIGIIKLVGSGSALSGSDFRAGRIIDDFNFTTNLSSVTQIQILLNNQMPQCDTWGQKTIYDYAYGDTVTRAVYGQRRGNPPPFTCLKEYFENPDTKASNYGGQPIPTGAKSAAQIIWEAGNFYNINPQVLVVTLQKEQGLLTDDWPFKNQFLYAMGAHCPDSGPGNSANCDPTYAGFSIQMQEAAKLFRYYLDNMSQPWWPYAKPGNRSILFNPSSSCGSSNVFIENAATAALYTYTPYQPNQAALNNLYGTGDSCSSYGNRNFWRMFNDWFGPSTGEGYVLATAYNDNGDPRQWVVYQGIRRLVPDPATAIAWGLNNATLLQWTGTYLGSVPESQPLTRLMRPSGSLDVYFVDSGKSYKVVGPKMLDAWNLNPAAIVDVSLGLSRVPTNSGDFSYSFRSVSNSTNTYIADGGVKRRYSNADIFAAWEGDGASYITLSDEYFNAMGSASDITGIKITNNGQEYEVVAGQKLPLWSGTTPLYPGSAQAVSSATTNRLISSAAATQFVKTANSNTIYLVDSATKHAIGTPQIMQAWAANSSPSINIVTQGTLNLLTTGSALNTYEADLAGQLYLLDGKKITVPSSLDSAYRTNSNIYLPSTTLMNLLPAGGTANNFIKGSDSSAVYLMDMGTLRHIRTPYELSLWGGSFMTVSNALLTQFSSGATLGAYVTDGTNKYIIESGQKHLIDNTTAANWAISNPDSLNASTLARFTSGSAMGNKLQNGGSYYLIHKGSAYGTTDPNIAGIWGINDAPVMNSALTDEFLGHQMLTRVASSKLTGDTRLFIVDRGILYRLYPDHAINLGVQGPYTAIDPTSFTVNDWMSSVVKDEAGVNYVVDGGFKRLLPVGVIRDQWTYGNYSAIPTMTNGFLNTLPTRVQMERTIKGSGTAVYTAENFKKRWIQNPGIYTSSYAPYTMVNDALINVLPNGSNL